MNRSEPASQLSPAPETRKYFYIADVVAAENIAKSVITKKRLIGFAISKEVSLKAFKAELETGDDYIRFIQVISANRTSLKAIREKLQGRDGAIERLDEWLDGGAHELVSFLQYN